MGVAAGVAEFAKLLVDSEAQGEDGARKQIQAKDNQSLAERAASDALERGAREAGQARIRTSQMVASENVAYANSGVDPTVGTAANVQVGTRALGELDARTIENNAAREAWGFRRYGLQYGQQAQLDASRTANAQAGTILGGAGRMAGDFSRALKDDPNSGW